jgi:hypothetical protein
MTNLRLNKLIVSPSEKFLWIKILIPFVKNLPRVANPIRIELMSLVTGSAKNGPCEEVVEEPSKDFNLLAKALNEQILSGKQPAWLL